MDFKSISSLILKSNKIFISSHINPDGDSLGSSYAFYHLLTQLGKDCMIINHSPLPKMYNFLNQENIFHEHNSETAAFIKNSDLGIILDIGDYYRLGDIALLLDEIENIELLNIDHHNVIDLKKFDHNFINTKSSSVGEIIYELVTNEFNGYLSKEILEGIYIAVLTDTGSFKHNNTTGLSHLIAKESINFGINTTKIYQNIYENSSKSRIKLLGNVIQNLKFDCNDQLVWFGVNQDMIKEVGGSNEDFEGFTDFFRSINGVEISLMLYDLKGKVRISLRSKGLYRVDELAKQMGGGGHPYASAALIEGDFSEVKKSVLNLISNYINQTKK